MIILLVCTKAKRTILLYLESITYLMIRNFSCSIQALAKSRKLNVLNVCPLIYRLGKHFVKIISMFLSILLP